MVGLTRVRWLVVLVAVVAAAIVAWHWSRNSSDHERATADPRSTAAEEKPADTHAPAGKDSDADESAKEGTRTWKARFIVTTGGRPVAGARVVLPEDGVEGTTDAEGTVKFERELPEDSLDPYEFVVRKAGFQTQFGGIGERDTIEVPLAPGTPARGRIVVKGSGLPVEGARVDIYMLGDHNPSLDTIRVTDADGWYTVAGLGDTWPLGLVVSAPGYAPIDVEVGGLPLPAVAVGGGARVEGRVTGTDGRPLSNALVFLLEDDEFWRVTRELWNVPYGIEYPLRKMWIAHACTDAHGYYAIRGLEAPRFCNLLALGPVRGQARARGLRLIDRDVPLRCDLRLEESASLAVEVTAATGELGWVHTIRLEGASEPLRGFWGQLKWSGEKKAYCIGDLTPGSYGFAVDADGFLPQSVDLELHPGETRKLEITLEAGPSITGVVVDSDGKPVSGIDVTFVASGEARRLPGGFDSVISDDDGRFRIGGLAPVRGSLLTSTRPRSALLGPGGQPDPYAPLRVENVEPDGEPVRLVLPDSPRIVFELDPCPVFRSMTIDGKAVGRFRKREEDRFTIGGLPLGKPVELKVEADGFVPLVHTVPPLKEGETRDLGKLGFQAGLTVSGRVVDESGAGVEMAKVRVNGSWSGDYRATQADGSFRILGVPPDATRLSVSAKGFLKRTLSLDPNGDLGALTITLSKGGLLVGHVLDTQGNPAVGKDWSLLVVRDEGGSGEQRWPVKVNAASGFQLRLEPGAYLLLLRAGEDADARVLSRRRFEIRKGEETSLDVTRR